MDQHDAPGPALFVAPRPRRAGHPLDESQRTVELGALAAAAAGHGCAARFAPPAEGACAVPLLPLRFELLPRGRTDEVPALAAAASVLCDAFGVGCHSLVLAGVTGGLTNRMHADPKFFGACR